jgi:succinate dehydrogenase/fumarate reductase flavoprotein subunit
VLAFVLTRLTWERVGLIRDRAGLGSALVGIEEIEEGAATVAVPSGPEYNLAWQDWLNLTSMTTGARLIARWALERAESRRSRFRRDFPESDPRWLVNVLVQAKGREGSSVWTEPVRFRRARPDSREPQMAAVEIGG